MEYVVLDIDPEEYKLFQHALNRWGGKVQEDILIEEMAELTKAIIKRRRQNSFETITDLLEELVDVEIMIDQMKVYYEDCDDIRKDIKKEKIKRLEERLE